MIFSTWRRRPRRRSARRSRLWPFIDQMNPAADTLALKEVEFDLTPIVPGQIVTIEWQKKPVFIRRRTPEEIKAAEDTPLAELRDPQDRQATGCRSRSG